MVAGVDRRRSILAFSALNLDLAAFILRGPNIMVATSATSMAFEVVSLLVLLPKVGLSLQCYECSSFPREADSLDEQFGPCPGWRRPPKYYGLTSLYNACMTVKLRNGTILAQNAVIYTINVSSIGKYKYIEEVNVNACNVR